MVSQLHCAVFSLICQMDTVQLLQDKTNERNFMFKNTLGCLQLFFFVTKSEALSCYLIVLDGLGQRFHLNSLI